MKKLTPHYFTLQFLWLLVRANIDLLTGFYILMKERDKQPANKVARQFQSAEYYEGSKTGQWIRAEGVQGA